MQTKTSQRESLFSRVVALFVAFVLATSFVNFGAIGVNKAWADDEKQVVTLTIVAGTTTDWDTYETSYNVWDNSSYAYVDGATAVDLLDAAISAGNIAKYASHDTEYGFYLDSITSTDGQTVEGWNSPDYSTSLYWSLLVDGVASSVGFDSTKLESGHSYQVVYDSYTSIDSPSDWVSFYKENEVKMAGDEAVLTIVAGTSTNRDTHETTFNVWNNKAYKVSGDEMTVADLLAAAKAAKDIDYKATEGSYGLFLESVTANGQTLAGINSPDFSTSTYWSLLVDGAMSNTGISSTSVKAGGKYQVVYDFYTSVGSPSDWAAFYKDNPVDATDVIANPGAAAAAPGYDKNDSAVSAGSVRHLINNISASYAGTPEAWKAMDLAALGQAGQADKQAVLASCLDAMKNPSSYDATAWQRSVIALTALGYDATKLPDGSGVYNAVEQMGKRVSSASPANVLEFTLIAYACGPYAPSDSALLSESALVSALVSKQHADGGFSYSGSDTDADLTAAAINAFAPYASAYESAANAMNRALSALKAVQLEDGGFGYTYMGTTYPSADSTAWAVVALCAAGINPATGWATSEGGTPLSALLKFASEDNTGFVLDGELNDMSTEDGLRALAAYQGFINTGAAFNLYTQAKLGQAVVPEQPQVKVDATETQEQIVGVSGLDAAVEAIQDDPEFAGQTIKSIELKVSDKDVSEADAAAIKELAGECDGLLLFDVSLIATTDKGTVDIGGKAYSMIGFTCAFDFTGKDNIKVFRVHDGKAVELASEPNKDGYFQMDKENGTITIYSMVFSSFGISYDKVATQDADPSVSAKTSDPMDVAPLTVLALGSLVTLCVATRRLNGSAE